MSDRSNPFVSSTPEFMQPNPQPSVPEATSAPDANVGLSPFLEPLDMEQVNRSLVMKRELPLSIPEIEKYPQFEFRIVNSITQEITAAHKKGFREVTQPELIASFPNLVSGTDKTGAICRPVLMARYKHVGERFRDDIRRQQASIYAGLDPRNKAELDGKYTSPVDDKNLTMFSRSGANWRIRTSK